MTPITTAGCRFAERTLPEPRTANPEPKTRVDVFADNQLTGERKRATIGYLTMVALDAAGNPTPVPRLMVETEEERAEYAQAANTKER